MRSNVEFQKLALQGITIIIASGDTGCGDLGPPPMSNPTCTVLHPGLIIQLFIYVLIKILM